MRLLVSVSSEDRLLMLDGNSLELLGELYLSKTDGAFAGPMDMALFNGFVVLTCAYDNTLRVIDLSEFCEVKKINVGAYPKRIIADDKTIYVACGDCDSIWRIGDDFEATYIDKTVKFPMHLAVARNEICVCGFSEGEVIAYDKTTYMVNYSFKVDGFPCGVIYADDKLIVAHNAGEEGRLWWAGESISIGYRIGGIKEFNGLIYLCIDDNRIIVMNTAKEKVGEIYAEEAIGDYVVYEEGIYISYLMTGEIKKISHTGKTLGRIDGYKGGGSLLLLLEQGIHENAIHHC